VRGKSVHGFNVLASRTLPRRLVGDDFELELTRLLRLLSGLMLYEPLSVTCPATRRLFEERTPTVGTRPTRSRAVALER